LRNRDHVTLCQDRGLGKKLSPAKSHSRSESDSENVGENHLAKMVREVAITRDSGEEE